MSGHMNDQGQRCGDGGSHRYLPAVGRPRRAGHCYQPSTPPGGTKRIGITPNRNTAAFLTLATQLENTPTGVPPAHEAAAFRALAEIPGVTARPGLVDAAGQPAIGLTPGPDSGYYFLLNPRTYAMIGITSEGGRSGALRLAVEVVSKPGQS